VCQLRRARDRLKGMGKRKGKRKCESEGGEEENSKEDEQASHVLFVSGS
jgi:hypothetical protein